MTVNCIDIHFENCFGIGVLNHKFDFGEQNSNSYLIYAPNGTMKTSFAKTLDLIAKNDPKSLPCDGVYKDRKSKFDVTLNGDPVSVESILVVNAETNYDSSSKISSFIASKDLKKQYDDIYSELEKQKSEYIKKLKQVSQSSDCETEFLAAYSESPKDTFYELLGKVSKMLIDSPVTYNFRYNDVFDKKGNVKKFLDKNQKLLSDYISKYDELLKNSKFFKSSDNSFGTYQAKGLLKSIEDNSFFEAGHKFTLSDNVEIKSAKELSELLLSEIASIVNDEELKKTFDKVDTSLAANNELRSFKAAIEKDNLLLVELDNFEEFRRKVWQNYISLLASETLELTAFYEARKLEIESIIREAKKEFAIWEQIIQTFNDRFYVPFTVSLGNQEDVVLKEHTANLEFHYKDVNDIPVQQDKGSLLSLLSKGEQRAFYILQMLFDVESRKHTEQDTILILDDIADSFDYKNKYAIVEYIKELHQNPLFKVFILTHNFDFYRTVAKRLPINRQFVLMVLRDDDRRIELKQGGYLNDIFSHFKKNISKPKVFVSIIPLVRNLIEYIDGQSSVKYLQLTSCLHLKSDTSGIICNDVLNTIQNSFPTTVSQSITFGEDCVKEFVYKTADGIINESPIDEILLENKIVLSIAIRLMAEEYMLSKIPNSSELVITSNQTFELFKHYKSHYPDNAALNVLERVNLMTPENIHVNAFMFEPLIDISIYHLIELFKSVKQLT